ncbi:helix-turn-helix domain-containing protein [Myxococcota bacterium]|nr:helix-turn-helix domain-containing protein [Myxococcota bacterium]MBU1896981.1 helix-turn-helix domain-containing protein [Myxococcota bacterium]
MKNEELDRAISKRVRAIRKERGLTLRALAEKVTATGASMTFSRLSDLERGSRNWGWESISVIAYALDISPGQLIEGGSKMIQNDEEQELIDSWRTAGAAGVLGWLAQHFPSNIPPATKD